jgi:glycosyltransferase involved in cell wall biosynthesis
LKSASAVLGNGASCERYIRSLGYEKEVFFVPYTIDLPQDKQELETNQNSLTFLFVGQLIKRKGVEEMVNALEKWNDTAETPIRLIVAGDGPEGDQLSRLKPLSMIDLEMLGSVEYDKIGELYRESDLFIFPTLGDEWGVVVNEALANHVPVIGSLYSQAVEELIVEGENGWLFYPDKEEEFEQVLRKALTTSPEKLLEMKQSTRQALQKVTVDVAVQNMVKAMNSVSG